jgi:hypothetical protein
MGPQDEIWKHKEDNPIRKKYGQWRTNDKLEPVKMLPFLTLFCLEITIPK